MHGPWTCRGREIQFPADQPISQGQLGWTGQAGHLQTRVTAHGVQQIAQGISDGTEQHLDVHDHYDIALCCTRALRILIGEAIDNR